MCGAGRGSRVAFSKFPEPFKGWKKEGSELGVMGCTGRGGSAPHARELFGICGSVVRGPGVVGATPLGWVSPHGCDGRVCVLLSCRESNAGVPGVWVFHVGSVAPLEHVEPGGGGEPIPRVPQSPVHRATAPRHADHASPELPARQGSGVTPSHPHHPPRAPALLGVVPKGLPASPGREQSRRLYPAGDSGAWQSYSANPSSYSSGHHGVGVEEDVHFNPDGE